jgi:hypothetical protein
MIHRRSSTATAASAALFRVWTAREWPAIQALLPAIKAARIVDLGYSFLAPHYIKDLGRLAGSVFRAIVQGGQLVFTIEHPSETGADLSACASGVLCCSRYNDGFRRDVAVLSSLGKDRIWTTAALAAPA